MPKLTTKPQARTVRFVDEEDEAELETPTPDAPADTSDPAPHGYVDQDEDSTADPVQEIEQQRDEENVSKATAGATKPKRTKTRPASAAGSLFTPLAEVKEYLRLLYWGREGSAKTTNSLTLANLGRVLVINAEGGLKKKTLARRGIDVSNIQVYPRPGEPITHAGLDEVYRAIKADLMADPESWAGVIFDSATDIVQSMVDAVSNDRVAKVRARDIVVDEFDAFFTDRGDYGTMSKMFRDILRKFRDLQTHLVITALERRDVDEDTGKVAYGPAVTPSLQADLLGYVDIVLHTKEADEERDYYRALTKRAGRFRTKDRLDALPKVMVEPTAERVVAYVEEQLVEATDPLQEVVREENRRRDEAAAAKASKKPAAKRPARAAAKKPEAPQPEENGE